MKNTCGLLLLFVLFLMACNNDEPDVPTCPTSEEDTHILLGNPSNATHNINSPNNYLIQLPEFALSYNRDKGISNWVCWHLDDSWLDFGDRQDDFRNYPDLPTDWYGVTKASYTNSGFDRGHNCPSADRTCSEMGNSATFYMINMIPQAPNHNRGVWSSMENFGRELVLTGKEVYVIMGNYGIGGEGNNGTADYIDDGKIVVPASIWKVFLILPEGNNDKLRIYDDTRIIAVDIPNKNDVSTGMDWHDYMTSVDSIEARSGYDIFSDLPFSLQNTLESKIDQGPW
jgi:endonuclease G